MSHIMRAEIHGTINGKDWPRIGEPVDLTGADLEQALAHGWVETATVEAEVVKAPEPEVTEPETATVEAVTPRVRRKRS